MTPRTIDNFTRNVCHTCWLCHYAIRQRAKAHKMNHFTIANRCHLSSWHCQIGCAIYRHYKDAVDRATNKMTTNIWKKNEMCVCECGKMTWRHGKRRNNRYQNTNTKHFCRANTHLFIKNVMWEIQGLVISSSVNPVVQFDLDDLQRRKINSIVIGRCLEERKKVELL